MLRHVSTVIQANTLEQVLVFVLIVLLVTFLDRSNLHHVPLVLLGSTLQQLGQVYVPIALQATMPHTPHQLDVWHATMVGIRPQELQYVVFVLLENIL